jgi:hypothetical protein
MHVFSGIEEDDDLSDEQLQKMIEAGDRIQKIASGEILATPEERDAAIALIAKSGA